MSRPPGSLPAPAREAPSAAMVTARLKEASRLSDLTASRRLATKVDMSAEGVTARLRQVLRLRDWCLALGRRS